MAYNPNKALYPGYAIASALERVGMSQKNLAERTGLSEKHISQIINGEASITVETSLLLENALGGSASFWINLEKNFQETKARLERAALVKKEITLLPKFPYVELTKRGCVEQSRNPEKKVENLWKFFGVNSLESVQTTEAIAYRRRANVKVKGESIAAWLRCGELESKENQVAKFSESSLKESLKTLRGLTKDEPEKFSKEARDIMAKSGVSLIYIPHFSGTGVSAAVRWINDTPLIQLSLYGAYADMFWFNLFHEIGHLLLHGKKEKFIEFNSQDLSTAQEKEHEADTFSGDQLITRKDYEIFIRTGDFSKAAVAKFAETQGIHPGIVEGRLCREKITEKVSWSKPLGFRTQLKFAN
jgi:HTH-type transcriptional regulator/antitoxin HigA